MFCVENFGGSPDGGLGWTDLEAVAERRVAIAAGAETAKPTRVAHFYPKVRKSIKNVAAGLEPYARYSVKLTAVEGERPVALRHLRDFDLPRTPSDIQRGQCGALRADRLARSSRRRHGAGRRDDPRSAPTHATLTFDDGSVVGNGFACFNVEGVDLTVEGGAQDGVGKGAFGGAIAILKGTNAGGTRVDGSVGESFAYGAQGGTFLVQGNADSRANIKGFAFEYMTNGRAVVLGDPGPWLCAGMTGGIVYQRLVPEMGLDRAAVERRMAKGAKITMADLHDADVCSVSELLTVYADRLAASGQPEAACHVRRLVASPKEAFIKIVPESQQVDPSISTE